MSDIANITAPPPHPPPVYHRVRMTNLAIERGMQGRNDCRCGILIKSFVDRTGGRLKVRVLRDRHSTPETYPACFWEPEIAADQILEATLEAFTKPNAR